MLSCKQSMLFVLIVFLDLIGRKLFLSWILGRLCGEAVANVSHSIYDNLMPNGKLWILLEAKSRRYLVLCKLFWTCKTWFFAVDSRKSPNSIISILVTISSNNRLKQHFYSKQKWLITHNLIIFMSDCIHKSFKCRSSFSGIISRLELPNLNTFLTDTFGRWATCFVMLQPLIKCQMFGSFPFFFWWWISARFLTSAEASRLINLFHFLRSPTQ